MAISKEVSSSVDPLSGNPQSLARKKPEATFAIRQACAVILAAQQVANRVPLETAVETAKKVLDPNQSPQLLEQRIRAARAIVSVSQ